MKLNMQVVSAGAVTSVGLSLAATSAAIRAGLDNFNDTEFFFEGEPIVGARVTGIKKHKEHGIVSGGVDEQAIWISLAMEECFARAVPYKVNKLHIILLRPDSKTPALIRADTIENHVYDASKHYSDLSDSSVDMVSIAEGCSGCGVGLALAQEWLNANPSGTVLMVTADTWLNTPRIQYGLKHNRILTHDKAEGFVPSEGAAVVMLKGAGQADTTKNHLLVRSVGLGQESAHLLTQKPCSGVGLADATREALSDAELKPHDVHLRLSNITGEEYFFEEAAMSWARLLRSPMPKNYEWIQPMNKIGNVGVVYGPLLIGYALWLIHTERHPGEETLIQYSSHTETRSAVVLTKS